MEIDTKELAKVAALFQRLAEERAIFADAAGVLRTVAVADQTLAAYKAREVEAKAALEAAVASCAQAEARAKTMRENYEAEKEATSKEIGRLRDDLKAARAEHETGMGLLRAEHEAIEQEHLLRAQALEERAVAAQKALDAVNAKIDRLAEVGR